MKQNLLAIFLFVFSLSAIANDTLTRAQVYDFSVGDTFDYYTYDYSSNGVISQTSNSYSRYIITDYIANTDSIIVVQKREFPLPVTQQTLVYKNLQEYEYSYLDNSNLSDSLKVETSSVYGGRLLNGIFIQYIEGIEMHDATAGLGVVNTEIHTSNSFDHLYEDHIHRLIYYSKGNETWGTPYSILSGINSLKSSNSIVTTYPNPFTNQFSVQLPQELTEGKTKIVLTNLFGQVLITIETSEKQNATIYTSQLPQGIYFATVYYNQTSNTVKLVKQ